MVTLTLNIHLPLLRVSEPNIPFLGGTMWEMPFETFNGLTSGAFESHKASYEQNKPVFFNYEMVVEDTPWVNQNAEPSNSVMEIKVPTSEQNYNNDIIGTYPFSVFKYTHDKLIDSVWETLILGVPTGQFIQPRHSITFINADNDVKYFSINKDQMTSIANFRGDADVEYIFMPEASGKEIDIKKLKEAEDCFSLLPFIYNNSDLSEALTAIKTSNLPYITSQEKFTICLSALENLIIPEVYEQIKKTFVHRIATILSESQDEYSRIYKLSKILYNIRNQTIHGQETQAFPFSPAYESQLLLSQLIKVLAEKISKGKHLLEVLIEADNELLQKLNSKIGIRISEIVNNSSSKLLRGKLSMTSTFVPGANTTSESESVLLYWSPLLGMATNIDIKIPAFSSSFTFLNTNDLISLEDKDIRRDFIAKFRLSDRLTAAFCLSYNLQMEDDIYIGAENNILKEFERIRNLLVVGLRLSGFKKFFDPELLGNYMYRSTIRYRQASVLRQSVFMELGKDPTESLQGADQELVLKHWDLLASYHFGKPSYEVELMLNLYRRIHESQYMPITSRASLCFILLEKLLGSFRSKNEAVQLEDLIIAVVGETEITEYFRKKGRNTRNSVAHGYWDPKKEEIDFLNVVPILDSLMPSFLDVYTKSLDNTSLKPRDIFINHILSSKM